MNKADLLGYLERVDRALKAPAILHIYGSAAFMLLENLENLRVDLKLWLGDGL